MQTHAYQGGVVQLALGDLGDGPADVTVSTPSGAVLTVPAFRSDDGWFVRYASEEIGLHSVRVSHAAVDLHQEIVVTQRPSDARGPDRGALRVAASQRTLEHADGTPFLWLGDTWWYGFVELRVSEKDLAELAKIRAEQGFTVIQIAVLPPEARVLDAEVGGSSGWPWKEDLSDVDPSWWDAADRRIQIILDHGLIPCIFASWGYHYTHLGEARMTRHWREMIARWGAHPVVWCLAGEASMLDYETYPAIRRRSAEDGLSPEAALAEQKRAVSAQLVVLNAVARARRDLDPFKRLTTAHPLPGFENAPWNFLESPETDVDIWMLQTGQSGFRDLAGAVDHVDEAVAQKMVKPVILGEASYEGNFGSSWEDVQRFQLWSFILSGAAGHTYGAQGVWAMNSAGHMGTAWGPGADGLWGVEFDWRLGIRFRGGGHVGASARWLATLDWRSITPRSDVITPGQSAENRFGPYGAELSDGTRLAYLPSAAFDTEAGFLADRSLDVSGADDWTIVYVNPRTGTPDRSYSMRATGERLPLADCPRPGYDDWILVAIPEREGPTR